MKRRPIRLLLTLYLLLVIAACDGMAQPTTVPSPAQEPTATLQVSMPDPTPEQANLDPDAPLDTPTPFFEPTPGVGVPTALPAPTGTIEDTAAVTAPPTPDDSEPSPTPVTATGTGAEKTALQALNDLRAKAIAWQPDAHLAMLANVRPGQGKAMLGSALGDPDVFEPTAGGKGRNWTLLAVSPSSREAVAFSADGTQANLVAEGTLGGADLDRLLVEMASLDLQLFDPATLTDSDAILQEAGDKAQDAKISLALLTPDGLGSPPPLAYQLFSTDPARQTVIFFDARSGEVLLDSSAP